jgi:hypothetical protein
MRNAAALAFGWLVPGGAYFLRRRYAQFAMALVLVCACLTAGFAMQGSNGWPSHSQLQGLDGSTAMIARAGAITKILAGSPFIMFGLLGYSRSFMSGQVHEYGTTLLIAAGLINILALADAVLADSGLARAK